MQIHILMTDSVGPESSMSRRIPMMPFTLGALLAGCGHTTPAPQPVPMPVEAHSYVCRPDDAPAPPSAEQHVTVRADDQRTGLLMRVGTQGSWRPLAAVPGSTGPIYDDAVYAWRTAGSDGVLTDIRNVRTYSCTADGTAAGPVK
jgi:hypothetical protein